MGGSQTQVDNTGVRRYFSELTKQRAKKRYNEWWYYRKAAYHCGNPDTAQGDHRDNSFLINTYCGRTISYKTPLRWDYPEMFVRNTNTPRKCKACNKHAAVGLAMLAYI